MDPTLEAAVVGAGIALFGVGLTAGAQLWQARATRRHELRLERLPLIREAIADFSTAMRKARARQIKHAEETGIYAAQQPYGPEGETDARYEPGPVRALEALRLVADDRLYAAGSAWLEEHYREHWDRDPGPDDDPVDLAGAEERFFAVARDSLVTDG